MIESTEAFDVVVLGGGAVGENAAARVRARGNGTDLAVALVERDLVGGECSYWACMPSKALLRPGEALAAVRRTPGARTAVTGDLDAAEALARRDELAGHWDDAGQAKWVADEGITLVRGHGRLAGERVVAVETGDERRVLTARKAVVVATGSRAAIPPVDGLADIGAWDSRDITTAAQVPERLLILGGGVVGVEMAQAWRTLGTREVTLVEMGERLLANEEPFVGFEVAEALRARGVDVRPSTSLASVRRDGDDGPVTARLDDGAEIVADELVVAAGREPNTDDIGLEALGLEVGGPITVDDQLRATEVEGGWLYAVGDCNGRNLLTHMGKYQARVAGDHIAGRDVAAWADHSATPRVIFTDPEVAAVGLTEATAREAGLTVSVLTHDTGAVAGAVTLGEHITGTSRLVVDDERRVIVGATFTGPGPVVGEMLHAATIAVAGEVTLDRLAHAVPAFPTVSEVWLRLLESCGL